MTIQRIAIGLVAVALFVGSLTAHAADFDAGVKAYELGDYATALRIMQELADQGDAEAQYNLGLMYENGQGVTQDYVQAQMWFTLAAARGQKFARKSRDRLAKQMTPAQIDEAQKLAREWKPQKGPK